MQEAIHKRFILDTNVEIAFSMFTQNKKLKTWLAKDAKVKPVVGGAYELFWNLEDRNENSTVGCKVIAIEKNELLSFEWKGPVRFQHFMNRADPLTQVTISFIPYKTKTVVHLIHTGWKKSEDWIEAKNWFDQVWENALQKLETVIAS